MKYVGHYPSYGEANERQLDLMAAEIEALVFYVPTGMDQVYLGRLPIYALFVPEESAEAAREVLRLIPDENHRCLYGCPHCGSRDVVERLLDEGFGTGWFSLPLTFGVVAFSRMIELRVRGRRYVCRACGAVYRKKP